MFLVGYNYAVLNNRFSYLFSTHVLILAWAAWSSWTGNHYWIHVLARIQTLTNSSKNGNVATTLPSCYQTHKSKAGPVLIGAATLKPRKASADSSYKLRGLLGTRTCGEAQNYQASSRSSKLEGKHTHTTYQGDVRFFSNI